MIQSGLIKLDDDEMIRLVGYSMGAAYVAGMVSVFADDPFYSDRVMFADYLAPFQPKEFIHDSRILGRQFVSSNDKIASKGKKIDGVEDEDHHSEPFGNRRSLGGHRLNSELYYFLKRCIAAGVPFTVKN